MVEERERIEARGAVDELREPAPGVVEQHRLLTLRESVAVSPRLLHGAARHHGAP